MHFDNKILDKIKKKGISIVKITLHVGAGTFLPIRTNKINNHKMHSEEWNLSEKAANTLNNVKKNNKQIIAVGTTTARTLETVISESKYGNFKSGFGSTNIFIKPGYKFKAINKLLTNFHMPKSTLLLLVCAAAGKHKIFNAYKEAIIQKYRFFSYGDCSLIEINL